MSCDCITNVLSSISSLLFLLWFIGLYDSSYADVDDVMLEEHYDALGFDLSFRG